MAKIQSVEDFLNEVLPVIPKSATSDFVKENCSEECIIQLTAKCYNDLIDYIKQRDELIKAKDEKIMTLKVTVLNLQTILETFTERM